MRPYMKPKILRTFEIRIYDSLQLSIGKEKITLFGKEIGEFQRLGTLCGVLLLWGKVKLHMILNEFTSIPYFVVSYSEVV
jgi:hypothetical protein